MSELKSICRQVRCEREGGSFPRVKPPLAITPPSCPQAEVRVDASQRDTADFLGQAEALSQRKRTLEAELERTSAFLRQYELSPAEAEALEAGPAGGEGACAAPPPAPL